MNGWNLLIEQKGIEAMAKPNANEIAEKTGWTLPCVGAGKGAEREITVESAYEGQRVKVACTNPPRGLKDQSWLCREETPQNSQGCVLRDTSDWPRSFSGQETIDKLLGNG